MAMMAPNGKIDFPNMLGPKRRRMRSGGNVSTATNNVPTSISEEKTAETSRCKGVSTIPIFLKSKSMHSNMQIGIGHYFCQCVPFLL